MIADKNTITMVKIVKNYIDEDFIMIRFLE